MALIKYLALFFIFMIFSVHQTKALNMIFRGNPVYTINSLGHITMSCSVNPDRFCMYVKGTGPCGGCGGTVVVGGDLIVPYNPQNDVSCNGQCPGVEVGVYDANQQPQMLQQGTWGTIIVTKSGDDIIINADLN